MRYLEAVIAKVCSRKGNEAVNTESSTACNQNLSFDKSIAGLKRNERVQNHIITSVLFSILVVMHLILSWRWIKNVTKDLFTLEKEVNR